MKQSLVSYAAALQLLALLLLQYYPFAPYLGGAGPETGRASSRRACCCSADRLASLSCRCTGPCCAHPLVGVDGPGEEPGRAPFESSLSEAPCGDDPEFVSASVDAAKFLRPEPVLSPPVRFVRTRELASRAAPPPLFWAPPDPPPEVPHRFIAFPASV